MILEMEIEICAKFASKVAFGVLIARGREKIPTRIRQQESALLADQSIHTILCETVADTAHGCGTSIMPRRFLQEYLGRAEAGTSR